MRSAWVRGQPESRTLGQPELLTHRRHARSGRQNQGGQTSRPRLSHSPAGCGCDEPHKARERSTWHAPLCKTRKRRRQARGRVEKNIYNVIEEFEENIQCFKALGKLARRNGAQGEGECAEKAAARLLIAVETLTAAVERSGKDSETMDEVLDATVTEVNTEFNAEDVLMTLRADRTHRQEAAGQRRDGNRQQPTVEKTATAAGTAGTDRVAQKVTTGVGRSDGEDLTLRQPHPCSGPVQQSTCG